jgi:hypothetical protein
MVAHRNLCSTLCSRGLSGIAHEFGNRLSKRFTGKRLCQEDQTGVVHSGTVEIVSAPADHQSSAVAAADPKRKL